MLREDTNSQLPLPFEDLNHIFGKSFQRYTIINNRVHSDWAVFFEGGGGGGHQLADEGTLLEVGNTICYPLIEMGRFLHISKQNSWKS